MIHDLWSSRRSSVRQSTVTQVSPTRAAIAQHLFSALDQLPHWNWVETSESEDPRRDRYTGSQAKLVDSMSLIQSCCSEECVTGRRPLTRLDVVDLKIFGRNSERVDNFVVNWRMTLNEWFVQRSWSYCWQLPTFLCCYGKLEYPTNQSLVVWIASYVLLATCGNYPWRGPSDMKCAIVQATTRDARTPSTRVRPLGFCPHDWWSPKMHACDMTSPSLAPVR